MYKILHWIFGWHYVALQYANCLEIRRVRYLPDGRYYVICYGRFIELKQDLSMGGKSGQWTPMTFAMPQEGVKNAQTKKPQL